MNDAQQLPDAPATGIASSTAAGPVPAYDLPSPATKRTWRERMPRGRKVITAGAIVAGLAVGGGGFGAGYAVGHDDTAATGTTSQQTTDGSDGRGLPGDGQMPGGPMGDMGGGQMGGQMPPGGPMGDTTQDGSGTQDGTGQQPDFDGDGQPDTDDGTTDGSTTDGSTSDSSSLNS